MKPLYSPEEMANATPQERKHMAEHDPYSKYTADLLTFITRVPNYPISQLHRIKSWRLGIRQSTVWWVYLPKDKYNEKRRAILKEWLNARNKAIVEKWGPDRDLEMIEVITDNPRHISNLRHVVSVSFTKKHKAFWRLNKCHFLTLLNPRGEVIPNEDIAQTTHRNPLLTLRALNEYGPVMVAELLNKQGNRTATGKLWTRFSVYYEMHKKVRNNIIAVDAEIKYKVRKTKNGTKERFDPNTPSILAQLHYEL